MKKLLILLSVCLCLMTACTPNDSTTTAPNNTTTTTPSTGDPEIKVITIAEALELCGEEGNLTEDRYYIKGTVETITNARYGAMIIFDETGSISVYNTMNADGTVEFPDMEETPNKGDEVLLYCTLQNHKGTKEVKSALLISFTKNTSVNEADYTGMTIADARGTEEGKKVKVDGVVAHITYANGQIPSGVYLVDDTNSIYIYDRDLAQRVQVGNKITVLASKTMWILDSEVKNAEKFGYKGCCQLEDAYLIENDNKTDNEFNKSWIPESTVKDILDTPVTENITTTLFKVNALVQKVPGDGFVNYYFFDLDGTTGGYTYTQCNGGDFGWLDQFDGKICTVYLSVINAKSTATDCFFRLMPVLVKDENFQFDTNTACEFAVKYHGIGQFMAEYTGDPALELITSISSELLGFENATLRYASSDNTVIEFREENGKTVMHCVGNGTATVTVTGSYGSKTFSAQITITRRSSEDIVSSTVGGVIESAASGEIVTVKGIVGPSLVNQTGFYLIDENGVIAIIMNNADDLAALQIGHEVVLEGTFYRCGENISGTKRTKQTRIEHATVVANYYGSHDYSTESFRTGLTISDFYNLSVSEDYTTTVFVMTATVKVVRAEHYTNILLTDGTKEIRLYCSNAESQYGWLAAYEGQTLTLELAACNWNQGKYYTGCVLAIRTEDGKVLNTLNFNHD